MYIVLNFLKCHQKISILLWNLSSEVIKCTRHCWFISVYRLMLEMAFQLAP